MEWHFDRAEARAHAEAMGRDINRLLLLYGNALLVREADGTTRVVPYSTPTASPTAELMTWERPGRRAKTRLRAT